MNSFICECCYTSTSTNAHHEVSFEKMRCDLKQTIKRAICDERINNASDRISLFNRRQHYINVKRYLMKSYHC